VENSQRQHKQHSFSFSQIGVISVGIILFVALFFADKSNLSTTTATPDAASVSATTGTNQQAAKLPPLPEDEQLAGWIEGLEKAEADKQGIFLDSIVSRLITLERFAYAADYAGRRVALNRTVESLSQLGELSMKATQLPHITSDSTLFRLYSDKGIQAYEALLAEAPDNEAAMVQLGVAYTESRIPQNSMKGIQTLKKVLDQNPKNPEASFHLGLFSIQTRQFDKAEQRFRTLLEIEPENEEAQYYLAFVMIQLQKKDEASQLIDELLKSTQNIELERQLLELQKTL